jgi:hypothetical protein
MVVSFRHLVDEVPLVSFTAEPFDDRTLIHPKEGEERV